MAARFYMPVAGIEYEQSDLVDELYETVSRSFLIRMNLLSPRFLSVRHSKIILRQNTTIIRMSSAFIAAR